MKVMRRSTDLSHDAPSGGHSMKRKTISQTRASKSGRNSSLPSPKSLSDAARRAKIFRTTMKFIEAALTVFKLLYEIWKWLNDLFKHF